MYMLCDMHCDTAAAAFDKGLSMYENNLHTDFKRLKDAGYGVQFFAVWISPEYYTQGFDRAGKVIKFLKDQIKNNSNSVMQVKNGSDFDIDDGRLKAVIAVEDGEALDGDISNLKKLYDMGVRLITLTWNGKNALGEGAVSGNGGLTPFGREIIGQMNRMGMIIDVSHLSERGFWDAAECSTAPIVASHSNAASVCPHVRNLTDEQIKYLIKAKGFMGINLCADFIGKEEANLERIYAHIDRCLSLGGEDILGFGTDFDGTDRLPCEIAGVQDMHTLTEYLLKKGINNRVLSKITSGNLIRVSKEIMNFFKK